jgi:hypothetical protein
MDMRFDISDNVSKYVATPVVLCLNEEELLPLYTDECDEDILHLCGMRSCIASPPPEQFQTSNTYMCIQRYA